MIKIALTIKVVNEKLGNCWIEPTNHDIIKLNKVSRSTIKRTCLHSFKYYRKFSSLNPCKINTLLGRY